MLRGFFCCANARSIHFAVTGLPYLLAVLLGASRDGNSQYPLDIPDFALAVSPASISLVETTTSRPVTVSVTGRSGSSGLVRVIILGLPPGATSRPASPFWVGTGATREVTFQVPLSVALGAYPIAFRGNYRGLSHDVQFTLTAAPLIRTYKQGSMLYLETAGGNETARVGLAVDMGGGIAELSWNGRNFVNWLGTGRGVQASLYDGWENQDPVFCCSASIYWNPVQAGDEWDHGSPLLGWSLRGDSIYIKTQPYQWFPEDFGGTPNLPVLSDIYVEQWLSAIPDHPRAFKGHYKITHFGTDEHLNGGSEIPCVFVNLGYDQFVYYGGDAPWTNDGVSFATLPQDPSYTLAVYAPEHWAALVDSQGVGLTLFVPEHYPYFQFLETFPGTSGPGGSGTNYFEPAAQFTFPPNSVLESDFYMIAGGYEEARTTIYDLRSRISVPDVFTPIGRVDLPYCYSQVHGTIDVVGWTFDNVGVSEVQILVDDTFIANPTYGLPRPDVATLWPNAPADIGFQYSLDTTGYANGAHTVEVKVTDVSGNVAVLAKVAIDIEN